MEVHQKVGIEVNAHTTCYLLYVLMCQAIQNTVDLENKLSSYMCQEVACMLFVSTVYKGHKILTPYGEKGQANVGSNFKMGWLWSLQNRLLT